MFYKYICKECNLKQEISKPIADYKNDEYCLDCGSLLVRDPQDLVCGYKNDKDFFGKSK